MKKSTDSGCILIVLMVLFVVPARAQYVRNREETCGGPVYSGRELWRRARITSWPDPGMTKEALAHDGTAESCWRPSCVARAELLICELSRAYPMG